MDINNIDVMLRGGSSKNKAIKQLAKKISDSVNYVFPSPDTAVCLGVAEKAATWMISQDQYNINKI